MSYRQGVKLLVNQAFTIPHLYEYPYIMLLLFFGKIFSDFNQKIYFL